jgi:hypothetical protein
MTNLYALGDAEHATVLAALRYYQGDMHTGRVANVHVIATNVGTVTPLNYYEIDQLFQRLNQPAQIDVDGELAEPSRAGDNITDAMLLLAVEIDDLDEALRSVTGQVGITTGDVAGVVFSGAKDANWWKAASHDDRFTMLTQWRDSEQAWGDLAPALGARAACQYCDQDIEWSGNGWRDRGGNRPKARPTCRRSSHERSLRYPHLELCQEPVPRRGRSAAGTPAQAAGGSRHRCCSVDHSQCRACDRGARSRTFTGPIMNLTPHDGGDLFTVEEFAANVEAGGFIRSDGDGYWATAEGYSWDHSVWSTPKPDWATHVAWFNR